MGKGEQKISLSSVSRGLVTQMSDTLIHKKQVQQERYQKVKFNQIHGRKERCMTLNGHFLVMLNPLSTTKRLHEMEDSQ